MSVRFVVLGSEFQLITGENAKSAEAEEVDFRQRELLFSGWGLSTVISVTILNNTRRETATRTAEDLYTAGLLIMIFKNPHFNLLTIN
jgi:hypothetical protein